MLYINQNGYPHIPYPTNMSVPSNRYAALGQIESSGCGLCACIEKSWYPELSKVHGIREDTQSPNTFTVYDRSSFLDAISSIHGAYSFTTTSTHDHLIKYGLIEKNYPGRIMESNEYIILKEASLHNEKLSRLLSALCISSQ